MNATVARGFSLVEALVALALVATASAALLPAVAIAARLQRDSAIETEASLIASATMESVKAGVAARRIGPGGSIDAALDGWHTRVDREGAPGAAAVFECRWRVAPAAAPSGLLILVVRVVPPGGAAVTLAAAVPDG
jgi:prepilin-type N-terminal cleavage/methylation domain-containing protein